MTEPTLLQTYERTYGPFIHMSTPEKAIWLRWLIKGGTKFAPFTYDVRVGKGLDMPPGSDSFAIKAAYMLTTKRIDVIYTTDLSITIVEVKQRAGLTALGQLIGYRDLLRETAKTTKQLDMLLVTDSLQPDMRPIFEQAGIAINEV